jgi:Family of unknown function (DUF6804)
MLTKILKCCSVIALLAVIVLRPSAGYVLLTQFLVCAAAIMATVESLQGGKPVPAVVFVLLAIAFNPVLPLGMSQGVFLGTATIALGMFMVSILTFRPRPRLSMASITDRTPGSESL